MIIIIIIILDLAVVSAHVLALKLMISIRRSSIHGSQRLLLIALCITELTYALVDIARQSCEMMRLPRLSEQAIWLFNATCITFLYIIIMTLITVERFLEIYLNIKYNIVCGVHVRRGLFYLLLLLYAFFCLLCCFSLG